jgi:hypothetical protein
VIANGAKLLGCCDVAVCSALTVTSITNGGTRAHNDGKLRE